jgi:hypothetical protein
MLTRKRQDAVVTACIAMQAKEAVFRETTGQVVPELAFDECEVVSNVELMRESFGNRASKGVQLHIIWGARVIPTSPRLCGLCSRACAIGWELA